MKGFLYITARNTGLNYLDKQRRQQHYRHILSHNTCLEYWQKQDAQFIEEAKIKVISAIEKLPVECRKIFKLTYEENLKSKEIANRLQISVRTVYNQKQNGLRALRLAVAIPKSR